MSLSDLKEPLDSDLEIAVVRVDLRINREFDYVIPTDLAGRVIAGTRVRIPFGTRKILGTVLRIKPVDQQVLEISSIKDLKFIACYITLCHISIPA